jgi:sterol desaturase/sphingolipid hydroxylase (fatty acid hydroxylase superfamily)
VSPSAIIDHFTNFAILCAQRAIGILLTPTSQFSLMSLACAFMIGAAFLIVRRPSHRPVRLRVLIRALLPRRWFSSSSSRADMGMMALNLFISGSLFGWAILSSATLDHILSARLDRAFGDSGWIAAPAFVGTAAMTLAVYLAYEFAYFIDHYLSHHVQLLWQFHRTHHSAETLSPMTNYRVHPVDSIVFYNIVGLCVGAATAVVRHIFNVDTGEFGIGGSNAILLVGLYLLTHLHHSHMWIAFTGKLGRIVLSPAHHQMHHSADPKHYNRNFGNTLGLFDWVAGTLYVPTKQREFLTFGAGPLPYDPHTVTGTLLMPFVDAVNLYKEPVTIGTPPTIRTSAPDSAPAATSSAA